MHRRRLGGSKSATLAAPAKHLRIGQRTAYQWAKAGKLPFKIGNTWRFDRHDVDPWLEEQKRK